MAREHARILCSVWRPGDDFRNRSPEAQRLYFLICSQRELNNAGVITLMVNKWSRCSAHTTPEDIETALAELEEHRYVVVDRDTEELLVRTFIRNDGVAKQPNVLKSALRLAAQIESESLRAALAYELVRLGNRSAMETAAEIAPAVVQRHHGDSSMNPSSNPCRNPSSTPEKNPSHSPEKNPSPSPAGWGGGRGKGVSPVPEVAGVGGNEPAPAPQPMDPTNPRCARHRDVPADDPGPNCRQCRDVRLQAERADTARADVERRSRDSWRAVVDACDECDHNGKIERSDGSLARHHASAAAS